MAFDEALAERIREILAAQSGLSERKMFGGIGFMLDGNMCAGVQGESLIARVPLDEYQDVLAQADVSLFPSPDRPMKGWITVQPDGISEDDDLERWIAKGVAVARALPPK